MRCDLLSMVEFPSYLITNLCTGSTFDKESRVHSMKDVLKKVAVVINFPLHSSVAALALMH